MNSARERILQRLRATTTGDASPPPAFQSDLPWSQEARIAHFRKMLEMVHGKVQRIAKDHWQDRLNQLLIEYGVRSLLIGPQVWPGSAVAARPPEGVELVAYNTPSDAWKDVLFNRIDAAVTGAVGAIAETGSIVLWPSAEEPRLMSLVPPLHLIVLNADQLFGTFAEIIQAQKWATAMPTNALLISGPSKSADIEQVLAYGVHGPKDLVVLLRE